MTANRDRRIMEFVRDFIGEGERLRRVVYSLSDYGTEQIEGLSEDLNELEGTVRAFKETLSDMAATGSYQPAQLENSRGYLHSLQESREPSAEPTGPSIRGRRGFEFGPLSEHDLLVDFGSENTLICEFGHGLVLNEPSIVTSSYSDEKVLAVGEDAKRMASLASGGVKAIWPLRDGLIGDFGAAQQMIQHFVRKVRVRRSGYAQRKVLVCAPHGSTQAERYAIQAAVLSAGAHRAGIIAEPIAAAIGAGMPVTEPVGSMIVDIGGGSTQVAVLTSGNVAYARSVRVGGSRMDEAIVNYLRRHHSILIGEATAERIKTLIGAARMPRDGFGTTMAVRGRNVVDGAPKEQEITQSEIAEALRETVQAIVGTVLTALEQTPPDLAGDIVNRGVVLTGGGALLSGLDTVLQDETGLKVSVASNAKVGSTLGFEQALSNSRTLQVFVQNSVEKYSASPLI